MSEPAPQGIHDRLNAAALWTIPVLAAFALILSLPRFLEGMLALSGNAAIEDLRTGPAEPGRVDGLVHSRERALAIVDRGKHRSELAAGLVLMAQFQEGDERAQTLDRAVREGEGAVLEAPADAYAWFHLAEASFAREGANQRAVDAVLTSIATGPYETNLLVPRLELLFASRSYLEHASDDLVDIQVRTAWKRRLHDVVRAVRRHGAADIVRRGLEREPSLAENLDAALKDTNIR